MNEEIGPAFQHRGVGAHPTARLIDPPAAGGVARPHERYVAPLARGGPETPDLRRAEKRGEGMVLKPDAIKHILPGRQTLDQRLGGEVGLRQSIDEDASANIPETVGGRDLV